MDPRKSHTISSTEVHHRALSWLVESLRLKDHGWLCKATVVWNIVLRAAARCCSLNAACRDLAKGPSDQAVFSALNNGLPKTLRVLENRLNDALVDPLPRRLQHRCWPVAIDWHEVPYYGQPKKSRNEICTGKPRQGTTRFHTYATACIVSHGARYTLAATWVRGHESTVTALRRLLTRIREKGLKIKRLLLDRAFFNSLVAGFLQGEDVPFVMPVVFRGRKPKKTKKPKPMSLRWLRRQKVGWHRYMLKSVCLPICIAYRKPKPKRQKLFFAAWRVSGSPSDIRDLYRRRFGIETSYRQWRQARIFTCTRDPHLRLLFLVIGLLLRNMWVLLHATLFAEGRSPSMTLHLEKLRLRRMLDWIALEVFTQLHDGSPPYVEVAN